jgi:hypothetical protein
LICLAFSPLPSPFRCFITSSCHAIAIV